MKLSSGVEILENLEGAGPTAESGHTVIYNIRIFLNHGDEVPMNPTRQEIQEIAGAEIRRVENQTFIDHTTVLGKRRVIAGVEKALIGMRVGGYRKVRVGPHLAYGSRGAPPKIPSDAVLNISLWLREIVNPNDAIE